MKPDKPGRNKAYRDHFFLGSPLRLGFFRRSAARVVSAPFPVLGSGSRRSVERRSGPDRRSFPLGDSIVDFAINVGVLLVTEEE